LFAHSSSFAGKLVTNSAMPDKRLFVDWAHHELYCTLMLESRPTDRVSIRAKKNNNSDIQQEVSSRGQIYHETAQHWRTVIRMKLFAATAVMLALAVLGSRQGAAQTDASNPGRTGATSTLRASRIRMPGQGGMSVTSPPEADFGVSLGDNSQTTPAPFSDVATPGPCTSGGPGAVALSTFGGRGLSPTSGGLSPTNGFTTSGIGAASTASAPCNSVSSSSGVTGSLNFANSAAATASGANSSTPVSPVSSGLGKSTPATATTSPNTKGLGVTSLGTGGLGTTGLGTTGLGSLPGQSATLQTTNSPSIATQAETSCSGDLAAPALNSAALTARSLSGGVPDPALSLGGSATDAAQRLGGAAGVPAMPVPCPTTSTMP
jgi:hypothetical protein